ncbi:NADPH dehydrogenase NamA [Paenibacillus sp.]|uniref:NADPH dehydrogenase NamA n=1 Tax=Paenibacillus sp. TaxID=58172 RepID=UPI002811D7A0|nr:NADPH dehydrogenase NamA [Paenibacillus sp.]
MSVSLFAPFEIRGVELRNRIVMSPMCMYSCFEKDGKVIPWHVTHYASRAAGGVGLVMTEATAVLPEGRISDEDLGIWSDDHVAGLRLVTDACRAAGAKTGIQLAHAGRKSEAEGRVVGPSAVAFNDRYRTLEAMTEADIASAVAAFRDGARRAKDAGFDVVELHAAHGYLLSEFLSPLANFRTDRYGGDAEGRFRMLAETIEAVRGVWDGPLFLRLSLNEYAEGGTPLSDFVEFARRAKALGVDLVDCSSGGVVPARVDAYPGYQVPAAEVVRREADIPVGAVGLIAEPAFAEHLVHSGCANLVFLGRALLRDPYWALHAAKTLGAEAPIPQQYARGWA